MKTFLAVVGALAITFVLAVVTLLIWLRWKVSRMAAQIVGKVESLVDAARQAPSVPPFRIKLAPVAAVEWESPEKAEDFARMLRDVQFVDAGTFIIVPSNLRLAAFCLPREAAYAIICEHSQALLWMEFVSYFEDGSSVTYSTLHDILLDHPDKKLVRFFEDFGAEELWRTFLRERPRKALVHISPEEFSERFVRAYAEAMDWRIARGGPAEEEIRRIAARQGQPCSPEAVQAIRGRWAKAIDLFHETEGADQLLAGQSNGTKSGSKTS